jgi:hypothetical protein
MRVGMTSYLSFDSGCSLVPIYFSVFEDTGTYVRNLAWSNESKEMDIGISKMMQHDSFSCGGIRCYRLGDEQLGRSSLEAY